MNKRYLGLSLGLSTVAIACTPALVEQDHPCPCAGAWTCCVGANVCVPSGATCPAPDVDASAVDAPTDSQVADVEIGPLLILLDSGVGGLCAMADAAPPTDASPTEATPALGGDADPTDTDAASALDAEPTVACMCSRRPGTSYSLQCPAGIGEYGESIIGPGGGTVMVQGRQYAVSGVAAEFDFPPMAVTTQTDIKLIETSIPPPEDLLDWSPVYLVEPAGLALLNTTRIQLPCSSSPVVYSSPIGVSVPNLSIWFSPDGTCFTRVPDSYTNAGFEQGSVTQLSYFIVGTPRTAATAACP
jgi:hypothetical protein